MEEGKPEKDTAQPSGKGTKPAGKSAKPKKDGARPSPTPQNRRKLRLGVIGLAVVVAIVAWVASRDSGGGSSEPAAPTEPGPPRIVTAAELQETAADLSQTIYWAGPVAGKELELNELGGGGVQVRYLPEGTEAGEGSRKVLTVGTYSLADPEGAITEVSKRPGEVVRELPDGRPVVTSESSPTNVYFASPDNSVQVEVYDPSAERAMNLALSSKVQPIG